MAKADEVYEDEYEEGEEEEDEDEGSYEEVEDEEEAAQLVAESRGAAGGDDDEEEEEDEEDEEEEAEAQPWTGLKEFAERQEVADLLKDLQSTGKKQVTVLLLGKSTVGKSSLVNALLKEQAVRVQAIKLQADAEITTPVTRQVALGDEGLDGFKLKLIDTCGLEDPEAGDTVNYGALAKIAEDVKGQPIDVVLYVDRLDLYRVEPLDRAVMRAISLTFGSHIWKKTILVLTHAHMPQTPPGTTYDSFADRRIRLLRGAIRGRFNPLFRPALPAALAENSDTCPVNERGAKRLPDESEWVVGLVGEVVDMALAGQPYKYSPKYTYRPGKRYRWLLPIVLAGQYLFFKHVLMPAVESDERLEARHWDRHWAARDAQRKASGLHATNRPSEKNEKRLEHMYDD